MKDKFEFYQTPDAFTRFLVRTMVKREWFQDPDVFGEMCVGNGAIVKAVNQQLRELGKRAPRWVTNDLDHRWPAQYHIDARFPELYKMIDAEGGVDWFIGNPPFTPAIEIIEQQLAHARVGVAMHLRVSIHEVLKTGLRRTWMYDHRPNGVLYLPRFAYQRNPEGKWSTDSVGACWVVWLKHTRDQFINYADEQTLVELEQETPIFRSQMDRLMAARSATLDTLTA